MNWDAIGAIAELLGAIGVIASLVYLAIQIRMSRSVVRTSNYLQLNAQSADLIARIHESSELHDLWMRGLQSYGELPVGERNRMQSILGTLFSSYHTSQQLFDRGQIDEDLHEEMLEHAERLLASPGVKEWWLERNIWFSAAFRKSLDERVASSSAQQSAAADSA
jgi:hypothetical protein